jgi:hypothetical protein
MKTRKKPKTTLNAPEIEEGGLAALFHHIEDQKKAAKKIFQLVTEERGTDIEVQALATKGAVRELIFLMIDLTKGSRAVANQAKSKDAAGLAKVKAQKLLYDWLDKNLIKFPRQLDNCAIRAEIEIQGLGRGFDWIRSEITEYRKMLGIK